MNKTLKQYDRRPNKLPAFVS